MMALTKKFVVKLLIGFRYCKLFSFINIFVLLYISCLWLKLPIIISVNLSQFSHHNLNPKEIFSAAFYNPRDVCLINLCWIGESTLDVYESQSLQAQAEEQWELLTKMMKFLTVVFQDLSTWIVPWSSCDGGSTAFCIGLLIFEKKYQ